METLKTMRIRHSCRDYTDTQITVEQLQTVLTAAVYAPIGRAFYENMHLTVIQDPAFLDKWTGEFRQAAGDPNANPLYGGKTFVVVSSKADTGEIAFANAACMVENMSLMATDLGLGHVYIYGMLRVLENHPEFAKSLGLPEGFRPISGIVLGYEKNPRTQEREIPHDRVAIDYIR